MIDYVEIPRLEQSELRAATPDELTIRKARETVAALNSMDWVAFIESYQHLTAVEGDNRVTAETVVFETEVELPQRLVADIRQRERIAVTHALAPTSECLTHQTLSPLIAAYDAQQLTHQSKVVATDDSTRAVASSRPHMSHENGAPVVLPAPSIQTTRIEQTRSGRARLTNDPQVVSARAAGQ